MVFSCSLGFACEDLTVRDAAFQEPRDVHRLCVIARSDDPQGNLIHDQLAQWLITSGSGTNLEALKVDAEDPKIQWEELVGIPSFPPAFPVVVLAGRQESERRTFFIHHWEPGPATSELASLKTSPVREFLRKELGKNLAVLILSPGTEVDSARTRESMHKVIETWKGREKLGIPVVELSRNDSSERVLLSFLGIPERGSDWVAIAFGKGKVLPPLVGEAITEIALNDAFVRLVAECTCLQTASSLGVDLPMLWTDFDDRLFVPLRDSEKPSEPRLVAASIDWGVMQSTLWAVGIISLTVLLVAGGIFWRKVHGKTAFPAG